MADPHEPAAGGAHHLLPGGIRAGMVASEIRLQRLRLSLHRPLDDLACHLLVNEFYERHDPGLRLRVLDRTEAGPGELDGFNALHRLGLAAEAAGMRFLLAGTSAAVVEALALRPLASPAPLPRLRAA